MLKEIKLANFRSYDHLQVNIDSDLVLILGENATGKTNFLESIYYASVLKSFRSPDSFLARAGTDYFSIETKTTNNVYQIVTRILPTIKRSLKINDTKVSRPYWKSFANLLFVPHDLNLFSLGPVLRRKLLDDTLNQIKKDYALDLVSLDHVLKQRSALLHQIAKQEAEKQELLIWNQQLAELAIRIGRCRRQLIDFLNNRFTLTYRNLTGFQDDFFIEYKESGNDIQEFLSELVRLEGSEISLGQNLLGPHREDWSLQKNKQLNIHNSSRGELRSQILTIKFLQAEYLKANGFMPVVLLDDVFSELDENRRQKMLDGFSDFQVFLTSTEEHHLPKTKKTAQIFRAEQNHLK